MMQDYGYLLGSHSIYVSSKSFDTSLAVINLFVQWEMIVFFTFVYFDLQYWTSNKMLLLGFL